MLHILSNSKETDNNANESEAYSWNAEMKSHPLKETHVKLTEKYSLRNSECRLFSVFE